MRARQGGLVRGVGAVACLTTFAVTGIGTVLVTRFLLAWAGYPKLGGGGRLHIAHMLWGGLLMAAAVLLAVVFLGRTARLGACLIGGVGFGLFIDEVGKQITDEPGYFYRPAAGIIYLTFVLLVLLARLVHRRARRAPLTAAQRTANAADLALTGITSGLTRDQRRDALRLVADSADPADRALAQLLDVLPDRAPGPADRLRRTLIRRERALRRVAHGRPAVTVAVLWVVIEATVFALWSTVALLGGGLDGDPQWGARVGVMISAVIAGAFGVAAAVRLRRPTDDPATPYRLLRRALLTDILCGQVFKFTVAQFAAVTELGLDLALLWIVAATIDRLGRQVRPAASDPEGRPADEQAAPQTTGSR
ncbi:hypothetical protein GTY65_29570 [Streptomyces sp. SID8379]|uniref:hypothetical protein n=1 Tax=unclassified Streptomyces TaxID=2593676 RepID=UPI00131A0F56|nr:MULTISPECIES: hypothetical protein [unclassified Streptomyces]MYW68194.1 hypothetical protein [Streptomyces sp. SID8379]